MEGQGYCGQPVEDAVEHDQARGADGSSEAHHLRNSAEIRTVHLVGVSSRTGVERTRRRPDLGSKDLDVQRSRTTNKFIITSGSTRTIHDVDCNNHESIDGLFTDQHEEDPDEREMERSRRT